MNPFRNFTVPEQVASHLRREVEEGLLNGAMPGVLRLEAELGVNRKTVEAALRILEKERLLIPQGTGKRRIIVRPGEMGTIKTLRVAILLYEKSDQKLDYVVALQHKLMEAGHAAIVPGVTLTGMGMAVEKIARLVKDTEADAWVVCAGSRAVLEWFSGQPVPTFALFGRGRRLPLAGTGPEKLPALRAIVDRLVELGHRRIVMLTREERRKPLPGLFEQAFLDELAARGISPGPYHLPDWEGGRRGFHRCLDALFRHTPPTALLISEAPMFVAAQQFLAGRGIVAPQQISMICHDPDPAFDWCEPAISHIRWDPDPMVRRIVRWADNMARGKDDRRTTRIKAEFVEGGTIGPVKGS